MAAILSQPQCVNLFIKIHQSETSMKLEITGAFEYNLMIFNVFVIKYYETSFQNSPYFVLVVLNHYKSLLMPQQHCCHISSQILNRSLYYNYPVSEIKFPTILKLKIENRTKTAMSQLKWNPLLGQGMSLSQMTSLDDIIWQKQDTSSELDLGTTANTGINNVSW